MNLLPQIEKTARDVTISHFFLMFGYKLFSLYFPLFLLAKNFSRPEIEITHFFIYLPIALAAAIVGLLTHRISPVFLIIAGIAGYASYSLGMMFVENTFLFYSLQIVLGVSAALFFVSTRTMLMGSRSEQVDSSFAWFYSAPSLADALAPIVGALVIFNFGFFGAFFLSFLIHVCNVAFALCRLGKAKVQRLEAHQSLLKTKEIYKDMVGSLTRSAVFPLLFVSFLVLVLGGFNNAFFVLFLKQLGYSQNQILIFGSVLSFVALPLSLWVVQEVKKRKSTINIIKGSEIVGVFSMVLGAFSSFLSLPLLFVVTLGKNVGGLMTSSGRSGLIFQHSKNRPSEAGALDTVFGPFATALGAIIGGPLILVLGYPAIFMVSGAILLLGGVLTNSFTRKE
jgi:MFS family permease